MSYEFARCMAVKCFGIAQYRGLCLRHYRHLQKRIGHGKDSWAAAEKRGDCQPQIRGKDGVLRSKGPAIKKE